jgi:hypothetical protein
LKQHPCQPTWLAPALLAAPAIIAIALALLATMLPWPLLLLLRPVTRPPVLSATSAAATRTLLPLQAVLMMLLLLLSAWFVWLI